MPVNSVGESPTNFGSGQFVGEKDNPFVASTFVGDGNLTAVGGKPRHYLISPPFCPLPQFSPCCSLH
jgi:hypothetical protein